MNREYILEQLVGLYWVERQTAKKCSQMGYHEQSSNALHQAYGIQQSAEALGIDKEDFEEAYKAYREFMRISSRQKEESCKAYKDFTNIAESSK